MLKFLNLHLCSKTFFMKVKRIVFERINYDLKEKVVIIGFEKNESEFFLDSRWLYRPEFEHTMN